MLPRRGCRTAYPSVATGKGEFWITGGGRGEGVRFFTLTSTTSPQTREVVPALHLSHLQGWLTCALGERYFWRQFLPPSREAGSLLFLLCAADSSLARSPSACHLTIGILGFQKHTTTLTFSLGSGVISFRSKCFYPWCCIPGPRQKC